MEDRDMWLIGLRMTLEERKKLNSIIKKRSVEDNKYNFIFANCSWHIFKILRDSFNQSDCSTKPYVSPASTIGGLKECNRIDKTLFFPAQATKILYTEKKMSENEKKRVWKISK